MCPLVESTLKKLKCVAYDLDPWILQIFLVIFGIYMTYGDNP